METGSAKILRIYLSNTDKFRHAPLYEVLVFAAKRSGLAGATVLKGVMGYGSSNRIESQKFWELNEKIPLVVELIDSPDKIEEFIKKITPWIDSSGKGCIITCSDSEIVLIKRGR